MRTPTLKSIRKFVPLLLASCIFTAPAVSADIARELRANADVNAAPDNFLEIGIGASVAAAPSLTEEESGVAINLLALLEALNMMDLIEVWTSWFRA